MGAISDNLISEVSDEPLFSPDLGPDELNDVEFLRQKYDDVFYNSPGCTDTIVHSINLNTNEPFRAKLYPIPIQLQEEFDKEVQSLLDLGIIRPSKSPYRSPIVMVAKPDGSHRLTLDSRALNSVTVFDAEPACSLDEELHKFVGAKYFTELDLTKAYHQIKLDETSCQYTVFATQRGLMEYCRLPFGLVTACATYIRLMRIVLRDLEGVSFYFDNVLIFSRTV